jgi:flagellar motor switch protein FliM
MRSALSQDEIDRLFTRHGGVATQSPAGHTATLYDFRRPDRIPKDQVRAVHLVHDFLARHLAASLGAYLRTYVKVSLVSVEQLAFSEFLGYLPTPTCIAHVGVKPMEGNAVLEINPSLVLPMLDIVLGGDGKHVVDQSKELTDIERSVMETIFRIVLNDLRDAWSTTQDLSFDVEETETQPQLMQILSPNEAVVAIGFEITLDDAHGMMNFGVPSVIVKMMGQKLDQQWSVRKQSGGVGSTRRMESLLRDIAVPLEARVSGGNLTVREVLDLAPNDILSLGTPITRPTDVLVSGVNKFSGRVVAAGRCRAFQVLGDDAKPQGATSK